MTTWFEDFKEIYKNNFPEFINNLKNLPIPEDYSLDEYYRNVVILLDFMEIIEKNKDQLKHPINVEFVKKGTHPSASLGVYLILEISNFYTKIYLMKRKGKSFPELPSYVDTLREVRNSLSAHQDKEYKLKSLGDHILLFHKIESIGGFLKIVEDFLEYYRIIKK